mmetsp:Transcript_50340/g.99129  ORF Transcript_50340/g.99129 Transcript_50340/m.99129 type:complete len:121 (-) Transcript_50340:213-575(-)
MLYCTTSLKRKAKKLRDTSFRVLIRGLSKIDGGGLLIFLPALLFSRLVSLYVPRPDETTNLWERPSQAGRECTHHTEIRHREWPEVETAILTGYKKTRGQSSNVLPTNDVLLERSPRAVR